MPIRKQLLLTPFTAALIFMISPGVGAVIPDFEGVVPPGGQVSATPYSEAGFTIMKSLLAESDAIVDTTAPVNTDGTGSQINLINLPVPEPTTLLLLGLALVVLAGLGFAWRRIH